MKLTASVKLTGGTLFTQAEIHGFISEMLTELLPPPVQVKLM